MRTSTVILTALAALESVHAVPHAKHMHLHARKNFVKPIHVISLAGRDDNVDWDFGTCGGSTGFTCGSGYCCSQWGYCGTDSDYCGAGCQFGACNGETNSIAPANGTTSTINLGTIAPAVYTNSPAETAPVATANVYTTAAPSSASPEFSFAPSTTLLTKVASSSVLADKGHHPPTYGAPDYSVPSYGGGHSSSESLSAQASTTPASSSSEAAPISTSSYIAPPVYSAPESSSSTEAPALTSEAPTPTPYSTAAAPSSTAASGSGYSGSSGNVPYKMYTGNGEQSTGWPSQDSWMSFESAWSGNLDIMAKSCAQWNVDNNSDEENNNLKSAIQSVAASSGVDERFILAIVMQESNGCVRAPTTTYSVSNPGLMQSYEGTATCNPGTATSPQGESPCPADSITQMISQGTNGSKPGDMSLVYALQQAGCDDVSKYYKAARIYNSGSVASDGDLGQGVATHCYASDVANRLTGWSTAADGCTLS